MQNIFMRLDNETGLLPEEGLLDLIAHKIEASHESRKNGACLGLIVIRWPDGANIRSQGDEQAFGRFLGQLARKFRRALPQGATGARLGKLAGRHEFGLLITATGRAACDRVADALISELGKATFFEPLAQINVAPDLIAGHALYPQDLRGDELIFPAWRRALLLRDRALLAADLAPGTGRRTLAYAWISALGAKILELLPGNFLRLNLGWNANIRTGQHFYVIGRGMPWNIACSKGQIIIRKVRETDAIAEIFHVKSAAHAPAAGDRLLLIQPDSDRCQEVASPLLQHADFLELFSKECKSCSQFTLSITKFRRLEQTASAAALSEQNGFQQQLAQFSESFFPHNLQNGFAGWYGGDGIIIFIPAPAAVNPIFENLHIACAEFGLDAATGIAIYPFLNFSRSDSEANALKALAYAELLPAPHIGIIDAQALAISGDRRFSQGDEPGALSEYRGALLLRPDDPLFLNSLGVCLAALNRLDDARQAFLEALANCNEPAERAKICYNLGNLFLKDNDLAVARTYYRQCVRQEPAHIYAWARLGQIYGKAGRPASSRALYRHAAVLAADNPDAFNMIQRQLARLETNRNQTETAREILHDSLLRNPDDHASLLLLAQTYLAEEPAMAETLARKCLRLGGDAWDVLASALKALGRNEEAEATARRSKNARF